MQENQIKVIGWIRSGMDYAEGIGLLVELTQKQKYSDQFTGREKSMSGKLAYEICKAAKLADHISWKDFIRKILICLSTCAKFAQVENSDISIELFKTLFIRQF